MLIQSCTIRSRRRGVSLVLVVVSLVSLFGMLAISLEGGMLLTERRNAQATADAATPQAAVRALAVAYLDFGFTKPTLYEAMFTPASRLPVGQPAWPAPLHTALAVLRDALTPLAGERDPDVLVELAWSGLHGLVMLGRSGRLRAERHAARLHLLVDQLAHGSQPRHASARE